MPLARFSHGLTLLLLVLASAQGCKPGGPVELPDGPVECVQCHMTIVDPRFAAQAHTDKGRVVFFDSIECALRFVGQNRTRVRAVYLRSFQDPPRWIESSKVRIARWAGFRSPMGGNLAAFESELEARQWFESNQVAPTAFEIRPWADLVG
jgi:copper chaperone NosL